MKKKKRFEKKLSEFIRDEGGFISKESILKIGLGTIAALGIASTFSQQSHARWTGHAVAPYGW